MSFSTQDYQAVLNRLAALADPKYKAFHEGLVPGVAMAYGVRVPELRRIARDILKGSPQDFLAASRPDCYEEAMLRGMVIAGLKLPLSEKLPLIEGFLPLIDNWAVCDTFCSGIKLKKPEDKRQFWAWLSPYFTDSREYYARFALVMFLGSFIEEPYLEEGLRYIEGLTQEQYYVRMAAAWAVSVCYVKFPSETLALLQKQTLPPFTQNKSIQKIRESYRVSQADKDMLAGLKRNVR